MRVLFLTSSQGTSADLDPEFRWSSYPFLVQEQLPEISCIYGMRLSLSVGIIDRQFNEIVVQQKPHVVILQCGVVEGSMRILPPSLRKLFRILPGGHIITRWLHIHRAKWILMLSHLGIRFQDVPKPQFELHLENIFTQCEKYNFNLILMTAPLLSDTFILDQIPGNNLMIKEYNEVICRMCRNRGIPIIDTFENNDDPTFNSLYITNTVHFTLKGHNLVANNVTHFLQQFSKS